MNKFDLPRIGIVGDGKLAKHFKFFFSQLDLSFGSWDRKSETSFQQFFCSHDVILLMITDDSILSFIETHSINLDAKHLFHFSGALSFSKINCCHPLMTFSGELLTIEQYQSIPLIGEEGMLQLKDVIPVLPNPCYKLNKRSKASYHAWCVMAGNFTTILWQEFINVMTSEMRIPEIHLMPYMEQIFSNLKSDQQNALTGPLEREDKKTILKNIDSIPDVYKDLYRSFLAVRKFELEDTDENSI
ncbi:MAG: DUF2520 domain-containing protein [Bacteriovoracaceae bacterium]|nr:DUF2520 domain-containing protein [Bacteriovoracaceae bacterium]